jgi:hypothetical protein
MQWSQLLTFRYTDIIADSRHVYKERTIWTGTNRYITVSIWTLTSPMPIFSEIASFSVLFSRPTGLTAPCVRHSSDTESRSPACSDAVDFYDQGGCQSQEMASLQVPKWSKWYDFSGFSYDRIQVDFNPKYETNPMLNLERNVQSLKWPVTDDMI